MKRRNRKQMAALLARRERDGLSLRELAAKTGIAAGTLSWWSWRLRQDSQEKPEDRGGFVEVVAEPAVRSRGVQVAIELENGIRLEVDDEVDVERLRKIVGALQTC